MDLLYGERKVVLKTCFHKNKQKLEKFILDNLLPSLETPLQNRGGLENYSPENK